MANLTFVVSHNMVENLEKSAENADFAEIVDFLNANPIRQGKDFSRRVTSLFETMLIQHPSEVGEDETVHEERKDRVEKAATTAASLEAEQDSGTINRTQSTTIPNEPIPHGTGSGGSLRRQDTIFRDTPTQTSTSITIANINITTAKPVTTVNAPITTAGVSVSTVEPSTPPSTTTNLIEDEDLIIAQTLTKIKSVKSKEKSKEKGISSTRLTRGVIMKEASETASRPMVPPQQQLDLKNKGKGIMQDPEKLVKVKGKDQIALDEEDNTQAIMEADYELAQSLQVEERLQAERQGELTIEERPKLFVELMDKRKKHFAKLKAEEIKRKPPTKAQKKN
nr:hypothetical protein [Tanacetum cinerariifolium]